MNIYKDKALTIYYNTNIVRVVVVGVELPDVFLLNLEYCYEKSVDVVYTGAKIRDIGRLAYGDVGRKNPRPYKPINKAAHIEPVSQGLLIGFATGSGPQKD